MTAKRHSNVFDTMPRNRMEMGKRVDLPSPYALPVAKESKFKVKWLFYGSTFRINSADFRKIIGTAAEIPCEDRMTTIIAGFPFCRIKTAPLTN